MGTIRTERLRGKELLSFEYDPEWLGSGMAQELDPSLRLFNGRQYPEPDKETFGIFMDSSPDRWGQLLMRRREASLARKENRFARKLEGLDYLLGVHDLARLGAIRFKTDEEGPFLACGNEMAAPPWTSLRALEDAARSAEESDETDGWLDLILAPGSSLGGARPKASVTAPDGSLWIAKFPARQDSRNSGAWEMVVHELAQRAGIDVSESRLERFTDRGSTFLTKRFDRDEDGNRLHFASAMTLLGKKDGAGAEDGTCYLEIAEFIMRAGSEPKRDLEQLWRRIVFGIAVSNTDDHLRNHGFMLSRTGWRLSPAYDMNPDPQGRGLSLNISETDNSLNFSLALDQAPYFKIKDAKAEEILEEILAAARGWKKTAESCGLSRRECAEMESAFRLQD
jgi:serine/threonine-protein kinase HipA